MPAEDTIRLRIVVDDSQLKKLKKATVQWADGSRTQLKKVNDMSKQNMKRLNEVQNEIKQYNQEIEKSFMKQQRTMLQFGLSIMFAGMAIKRVFDSITKSSVNTFMKISEGATPAGQAITALSAGFEYLRFTVGNAIAQALLPFLPTILSIIDSIGDWIDRNPQLAGQLVILGVVLGTIMLIVGQGILLFTGIKALFGATGITAGILSGGLLTLATTLGILLIAVAILWNLWRDNFGNMQTYTSNIIDDIALMFGSLGVFLNGVFTGDVEKMGVSFINVLATMGDAVIQLTGMVFGFLGRLGEEVGKQLVEKTANAIGWIADLISIFDKDAANALRNWNEQVREDALTNVAQKSKNELDGMAQSFTDFHNRIRQGVETTNLNMMSDDWENIKNKVKENAEVVEETTSTNNENLDLMKDYVDLLNDSISGKEGLNVKGSAALSSLTSNVTTEMDTQITKYNQATDAINSYIAALEKINMTGGAGVSGSGVPALASGGYISSDGFAYLHAGEIVVPANAGAEVSNNVNLNANFPNVTNAGQAQGLTKQISEIISKELRSSLIRGGLL